MAAGRAALRRSLLCATAGAAGRSWEESMACEEDEAA